MGTAPRPALIPLVGLLLAPPAWAQDVPTGGEQEVLDALASWIAVDMATGYETRLAPSLAQGMDGWDVDHWGNLVMRVGSGAPRRVVACALDRPSYAVSQITEDGYLRVHRIGGGSSHPLWDQAFEAQQIRILTETGPVAGVVARSNAHFSTQHRNETAVVTADDLWLDVGAESAAEVAELGIRLLDPVARHLPPWTLAGGVAGPDAGARVGCAVVAKLASEARLGSPPAGETQFILSAQAGFGGLGLYSHIARNGSFDDVMVLGPRGASGGVQTLPAASLGRAGGPLEAAGVTELTVVWPAVRAAGSHMEQVRLGEAARLLREAADHLGVTSDATAGWVTAPPRPEFRTAHMDPDLQPVADLLTNLVERHGVPGHEWAVRRFVLESLPDWARDRAQVDDVGNVWVEMGPDRDTTVFMAHLDEVGYLVESIAPDGTVTLDRAGGAASSAWEGQTALLHFDPPGAPSTTTGTGDDTDPSWKARSLEAEAPPPVRGVFLTRDDPAEKDPGVMRAWFGLDAVALGARGIGPGMAVTSHKEGLRMGPTRFVARALDDRAGTTALLLAIRTLEAGALDHKVIFSWSVHEEGGLVGAEAMARRWGSTARRIYSVDTFVSSDTPLESPHYAHAPLGSGPVLRAIENSGASPDRERARVRAAAASAGIPLQMGLTQGGTDGTTFTFYGTPNQGLSWPGRYSHSPGEVLDLRDLAHLADLVAALATTPES